MFREAANGEFKCPRHEVNAAFSADDGRLVENMVQAVEGMAGKAAGKLDPLAEQYAGLSKTGLHTPVMRKPTDDGMDFEETWLSSMDVVPFVASFIPAA